MLCTQATHEAPVSVPSASYMHGKNTVRHARYLCAVLCSAFFFLAPLVPSRRESVPGLRVSMALFLVTSVECGLLIDLSLGFPSLGIGERSVTSFADVLFLAKCWSAVKEPQKQATKFDALVEFQEYLEAGKSQRPRDP